MKEFTPRKTFLPKDDDVRNLPYPYNIGFPERICEKEKTVAGRSAGSEK